MVARLLSRKEERGEADTMKGMIPMNASNANWSKFGRMAPEDIQWQIG